jgi:hypothetical protein
MPRVGRNSVRFKVDGVTYVAMFQHLHAERVQTPLATARYTMEDEQEGNIVVERRSFKLVEKPLEVKGTKGVVKASHITTCFLRRDGATVAEGRAVCSVKEPRYDWRKGLKIALTDALASLGVTPEAERQRFGKFLEAFFTELGHRDEPAAPSSGYVAEAASERVHAGLMA